MIGPPQPWHMARDSGLGFPTDELLVGVLLAVVGVSIGETLGVYVSLAGAALGLGAYLVAAITTIHGSAGGADHAAE